MTGVSDNTPAGGLRTEGDACLANRVECAAARSPGCDGRTRSALVTDSPQTGQKTHKPGREYGHNPGTGSNKGGLLLKVFNQSFPGLA